MMYKGLFFLQVQLSIRSCRLGEACSSLYWTNTDHQETIASLRKT